MIPSTALFSAGAVAPQGDTPVAAAKLPLEGEVFADLLAALPSTPSASFTENPQSDPVAVVVTAKAGVALDEGQTLPATGKILPEVLPVTFDREFDASTPAQAPEHARLPVATLRQIAAASRALPAADGTTAKAGKEPQLVAAETAQIEAEIIAIPIPFLPFAAAPGQMPAPADGAKPAVDTAAAQALPLPGAMPPAVPAADTSPAPRRPFTTRLEADQAQLPSAQLQIPSSLAPAAAAPSSAIIQADPLFAALRRISAARPAARRDPSEQPAMPVTAPASLLSAAELWAPALQPAPNRPQDFTALVDRLAAAREAVQPQIVTLAVPHPDFGPVQMHFRREADGLTVRLSNADPDFGRSVQSAAAAGPVDSQRPEPASAALTQPGARQSGNMADNGPALQHRGPPLRGEPRLHRNSPKPSSPGGGSDRRSGIFA